MKNIENDITLRTAAVISGIAILAMTIAAIVATNFTIGSLIVIDNPAATTNNLMSGEFLFRVGLSCWMIILISDVIVAWGLYIFLKSVHKDLSLLMAWSRLIYAAVLGAAMINYVNILWLISNNSSVAKSGIDNIHLQVVLLLNSFDNTWSLGLVVFGIHLLLLGYLAYKSKSIPKVFGILLMIAFAGYIIINLGNLLLPDYENYKNIIQFIFIIPMLSEVALGIWLLLMGGKNTFKNTTLNLL